MSNDLWGPLKIPTIEHLVETVQRNCDISDANFAGDYTLCVYLLKMREFYRWQQGVELGASLDRQQLGEWVTQHEDNWDKLEACEFEQITIDQRRFDAFDVAAINEQLNPHRLAYSAGYGRFSKPCFVLADLNDQEVSDDYALSILGHEYARELAAPPAMIQGKQIIIRKESLRRMLWERLEEWQFKRRDNPMGRVMHHYDFETDLSAALDAMTEHELESLVLHEIGESVATSEISGDWDAMLQGLSRSTAEVMARAVKDNLADCMSVLPALISENNIPSLHFYFANLTPMRKELFPSLIDAYRQWDDLASLEPLREVTITGRDHWLGLSNKIVHLYEQLVESCAGKSAKCQQQPIELLVTSAVL